MGIDWSIATIQGAVIGAAMAAFVAVVLGAPALLVSRCALKPHLAGHGAHRVQERGEAA